MKKILLSTLMLTFVSLGLMAQTVSKSVEKKVIVLEDLTGVNCGYCPDGARIADEMKAARNGKMIIIANHGGPYATTIWKTPEGTFIDQASNPSGYPNGNINRRKFGGAANTAHSRGAWDNNGKAIEQENSPVNIGIKAEYDPGMTSMDIAVTTYFTESQDASRYIHIAILQDSILAPQSGASSFYPSRMIGSDFIHMDVMRDYITQVKFGSQGYKMGEEIKDVKKDDQSYFYYNWIIPPDLGTFDVDMKNIRVIAFVTEELGWSEIYTGVELHPTEKAAVKPVGINEANSLQNLRVYPNPFKTTATVEFNLTTSTELQVTVFDVTGKAVQNVPTAVYPVGKSAIQIDGSGLETGLYYVNIVSEDNVITRKIALNK